MQTNSLLKSSIAAFGILASSVLLTEAALRIVSQKKQIPIIEGLKYSQMVRKASVDDPFPLHIPHLRTKLMGRDFDTNSLGMRDDEVPVIKTSEERRILVLGSSVALGWGISHEQTFGEHLEAELTERHGGRYRVMNAAVANTTTATQLGILKTVHEKVLPNQVVLLHFLYDARHSEGLRAHPIIQNSYLSIYLYDLLLRAGAAFREPQSLFQHFDYLYSAANSEWKTSLDALKNMVQFCKLKDLPFTVLLYPELHDLNPGGPNAAVFVRIAEEFRARGATVLDRIHLDLSHYIGRERDLWVAHNDPHGNEVVQRTMVKAVLPHIK